MQTHSVHTYTIDEHPNQETVYDWIRSNWHDLGENSVYESIDSLKGFCSFYNVSLDNYSIGIFPDRGECIDTSLPDDISELSGVRLFKYLNNNYSTIVDQYNNQKRINTLDGNCPFTGV